MKNDNRTFEDVVKSICQSEEDVNKILKAAKLDRHESPGTRLSAEQKTDLIGMGIMVMFFFGLLTFLAILFLS